MERFGRERLQGLTREEIDERFGVFRELTHLNNCFAKKTPTVDSNPGNSQWNYEVRLLAWMATCVSIFPFCLTSAMAAFCSMEMP